MISTDLHLHSCLSPCGADDMDPGDVVRMAKIIGIDLVALTDHNSAKNCRTAEIAAKECGIGFIPGLEVTAAEEIHCIGLFPTVGHAILFGETITRFRPHIKNRPDIFGNQLIVHPDGTIEVEPNMLYPATSISIMDLPRVVRSHCGLFWPAHVDRGSNSLFAMLGSWPQELEADAVEFSYKERDEVPDSLKRVKVSDAHSFRDMRDEGFPLPLKSADFDGLAAYLRGTN